MTGNFRVDRPSFLSPGSISLKTTPCSWNRCIFCGLSRGCVERVPTLDQMIEQVRFGLERFPDVDIWSVFNRGSFFDDNQVPETHRAAIADCLRRHGVRKLVIESRPEFVTDISLTSFREALGTDREITMGVGLETSDEKVLNLVQKGISLQTLKTCISLLRRHDFESQVFLMAGLPGGSEPETTLRSIQYAREIGADQVMISATVPRRGTQLRKMWKLKEWKPIDITLFYQIVESAKCIFGARNVEVWPCGIHYYQDDDQKKRYKLYKDRSTHGQMQIEDFNGSKTHCTEDLS